MDFTTDIFSLDKPSSVTFNLVGTRLPNNHDLFFCTKQRELAEQYSGARIFLRETETDDWKHWFNPVEDDVTDKAFKLIFRSHFYETALFYYNAIVDMSWTLCYSLPERACCRAYSLISEAQITSSSTLPRITSISVSVSSGGSLKSCCASLRFASALARHSFLALQKPHHSPHRKFPSPAKAKSAVGFKTSSAQRYKSSLDI